MSNSVGIVMVGLSKTGKTTVINQLCDKEFDGSEYNMTSNEEVTDVDWEIGKNRYNIRFWDASGNSFINSRTTANTFVKNGPIHILCCAKNNAESVEFLQGVLKEVGSDSSPLYRMVFMNYNDQEEDDDSISNCKQILPDDVKLYQFNALEDKQQMKDVLSEFFRRAVVEHEEIFKDCKSTGKKTNEDKKKVKETKDKKKGSCLLF
ncbi:Ras family protein [Entamoeba marina]